MRLPSLLFVSVLAVAGSVDADTLVFDPVHVITMSSEDEVLMDRCVVVAAGRITALEPAGECSPPDVAERIEGGWLIPGLAEMHAHIPTPDSDESVQDVLTLMVANGVTTARGMLGAPYHLELREQIQNGEVFGPRLVTSGPSINGSSAPNPDTAENMLRAQHAAGYDFAKLHPGLDLETFQRISEVAGELSFPFAGHVSVAVGVQQALRAGQASIDHLDGYAQRMVDSSRVEKLPDPAFFGFNYGPWLDADTLEPLAAEAARHDTWMVPTQTLIENVIGPLSATQLSARPEMRYASDGQLNGWAAAKSAMMQYPLYREDLAQRFIHMRRDLIKAMQDAGVGLLLGSDAPQIYNVPGFALHRELQLMVDAGLTPWQALAMGTANVARFLGRQSEFGTIREGMVADLVLLAENPLQDIGAAARPDGVVLRGQWLPARDLRQRLSEIEARLRQ